MKSTRLSIVIVTRGVAFTLQALLETLIKQIHHDDEIIVIARNNPYIRKDIFRHVHIIIKPTFSQSQARNYAIFIARHNWIAFIDDDCIPQANWVREVRKSTSQENPCIQGQCNIGNLSNIWSIMENFTMHVYQDVPLADQLMNGPGIKLTTKNLLINKKNIPFSPIFPDITRSDVHEDALLLLKLNSSGIQPRYRSSMIVRHSPQSTMGKYLSKLLTDGKTQYWKKAATRTRQQILLRAFRVKLAPSHSYKLFEAEMATRQRVFLNQNFSLVIRCVIIIIFNSFRPLFRGIGFQYENIHNILIANKAILKYLDLI